MIEIVDAATLAHDGLIVIDEDSAVWRTFAPSPGDVVSWLWWWLAPGKRASLLLRGKDGRRTRVRAKRIARTYVRIGGSP
jgi:hypothetical protein